MHLSSSLQKEYSDEHLSARDAQYLAHLISWGPVLFQASRLMIKFGIFEFLVESKDGLTRQEICDKTHISDYAVKCLLEASLTSETVIIDAATDRFSITKTGWFLLNDPSVRADINFNHDVNYIGWFNLEESFVNGKPEGLKHFGSWLTIYEGLSSLPPQVRRVGSVSTIFIVANHLNRRCISFSTNAEYTLSTMWEATSASGLSAA